jgi:autotransporter-associated beta strand protein
VTGAAAGSVTLAPSSVNGTGTVTLAGYGTISYSGVSDIDFVNQATATVQTGTVNDDFTFEDSTTASNFATVPTGYSLDQQPAMLALDSNANGDVTINLGLHNIGTATIDTVNGGGDGKDTVGFFGDMTTDEGVSNLAINTGTGADSVTLDGNLAVPTSVSITSGTITNPFGAITTASLTTSSVGGTTLSRPQAVGTFNATNSGSGNISLTNSAPTLNVTGLSEVNGGTATINNTGALTFSNALSGGYNLSATSTGLTTFSAAIGSPTPLTSVSLTTAGLTAGAIATTGGVTVNDSGDASITGIISGSGAPLAKRGDSTLTLSGANNYTGSTSVTAGTLLVNGSTASASAVTVSGTAQLGGTGSIGGSVTVNSGGHLAPSNTTGTLSTGSLSLASGASFDVAIGGNTAGNYSQDRVSGTIVLGGATLNLSAFSSYMPQAGDSYVLIDNPNGDGISGTFVAGSGSDNVSQGAALAEGAVLSKNFLGSGLTAKSSYQGGPSHNQVVVHVAATPTLGLTAGSTHPTLGTTTVVIGTGDRMTATATLANGVNETGSITFTLYGPDGGQVDQETAAVSGDGTYATPKGFLPRMPGTYQWVASYPGDNKNYSAATSKGSTPEVAVGPGVTVVGTSLYLVGGNGNDHIDVRAAPARRAARASWSMPTSPASTSTTGATARRSAPSTWSGSAATTTSRWTAR